MNGILPLWKEKGMTSHDCVFKVRKILKMKKVGHTGTLDPDVEGVLPICLGRATKLAEYIMNSGKVYEGEVTIGFSTTTEDASGDIVEQQPVSSRISRKDILSVLQSLTGEIMQTPPMFSAVKVNGKRLYEYARQGIEVERPSRKVTIHQLDLLDEREWFEGEAIQFSFRASCSKGTYIRTLAVMIGERLGYPAHMSKLVRTSSGGFDKQQCITLDELKQLQEKSAVSAIVQPLERGVEHLPKWTINDTLAKKVMNGSVLDMPADWPEKATEAAVFSEENLLAIYKLHPDKPGKVKPVKVLAD
ncbi:tRNA pseudouridine(55) synthase TruB [Pseudobacillus badius]|uniref:tRNA pseudouridine(55) synthase TruB n=1 Tax=Bacillus badius TaxID=1455 RepID=UPI0007B046A1|nr:tRNA pseudouridine(55) synthase TruB [Bacillus badius]KZO01706.1 tRNA pseudouridine(55) synthase [Bacillus badius]MED0667364.1 tRNA pseudouridine(55) synthase TruB [Bacillus badius]OCS90099.1 tRNA pseudouridine(55) synthase TruB [Bacillus badius]OVE53627.1 tRNA pseudouridine(55) synthase TruB [Bacillus badius]TDW05996.1 tRNA pseudouridine synthase B [Bacillus badius]